MLLALVVLPLYVPMLLLGGMAGEAALAGSSARAYLLLQAALALAALPLALLASSALLKMHLRST
jgi:heme exporter protein B